MIPARVLMGKVQVHGDSLKGMGQRFVAACRRAEGGEPVEETHVTFLDLDAMLVTLSPRRLALLRHVRQHGASSIRALAEALGHDPKREHGDVAALEVAGLLVCSGRKLSAPWNEVQASVSLT